jgi:DNA-binding LacI/PurR family transcriptional regulator
VRAAAARAGVALESDLLLHGDWTVRGGVAAGEQLLARRHPPTAVLAASDEMAIGILHAARCRHVSVPGGLSVAGIDDHEMSFTHDLTTIRQQVREQGRAAALLLLDALAGRSPGARRDVILPTELVQRGSTAAPERRSRALRKP